MNAKAAAQHVIDGLPKNVRWMMSSMPYMSQQNSTEENAKSGMEREFRMMKQNQG